MNTTPAGFTDITDLSPNALIAFLATAAAAVTDGATPADAAAAGRAAADAAHAGEPETVADLRPSDLALALDYARYTCRPVGFTTTTEV